MDERSEPTPSYYVGAHSPKGRASRRREQIPARSSREERFGYDGVFFTLVLAQRTYFQKIADPRRRS